MPVYTNEDLVKYAPYRTTEPAAPDPPAAPTRRAHGEAYWRREHERLQDRLRPLRGRADELRLRIEERRHKPGVRPYTDPQIQAWERRLRLIEEQIRDWESRLEERARREGALPGWLR